MDKIKVMGFHQPPSTILFDDPPYPNDTPKISPHKMHKGCRNDYIEVFGAVYWAKKAVLKNLRGVATIPPPSEDES